MHLKGQRFGFFSRAAERIVGSEGAEGVRGARRGLCREPLSRDTLHFDTRTRNGTHTGPIAKGLEISHVSRCSWRPNIPFDQMTASRT